MLLFAIIITFLAMAAGFALYLVRRDRGEHEPVGALWMAFGLGFLAVAAAAFLELKYANPTTDFESWWDLTVIALGIGAIEELCKAVPLALYLYRKRYFNEHTDGVIYFALAGLGFGLPENVLYTLSYGARAGLARIILTPLFHAATTAIIGYMLARVKIGKQPVYKLVLAIIGVVLLHSLYDFGLLSGNGVLALLSIALTAGLTASLFMLFIKAKHLDEAMGLSSVGNNSFCRSCGQPNPKHNLYCSRCGKRA